VSLRLCRVREWRKRQPRPRDVHLRNADAFGTSITRDRTRRALLDDLARRRVLSRTFTAGSCDSRRSLVPERVRRAGITGRNGQIEEIPRPRIERKRGSTIRWSASDNADGKYKLVRCAALRGGLFAVCGTSGGAGAGRDKKQALERLSGGGEGGGEREREKEEDAAFR